jgi:hypothetical protein
MLEKTGGRTRIRTLDPLIKSLVVSATFQGVRCKTRQDGLLQINKLGTDCKTAAERMDLRRPCSREPKALIPKLVIL